MPFAGLERAEWECLPPRAVGGVNIAEYRWRIGPHQEGTLDVMTPFRQAQAEKRITQKKISIDSLYMEQKSPYPGAISANVVCPLPFRPRIKHNVTGSSFFLNADGGANKRKIWGVCAEGDHAYHAFIRQVYCGKNETFYELNGFVKKANPKPEETWLAILECKTGAD